MRAAVPALIAATLPLVACGGTSDNAAVGSGSNSGGAAGGIEGQLAGSWCDPSSPQKRVTLNPGGNLALQGDFSTDATSGTWSVAREPDRNRLTVRFGRFTETATVAVTADRVTFTQGGDFRVLAGDYTRC